jgi:hypothetical protein
MSKCTDCDKPLTQKEVFECHDQCIECNINTNVGRLAFHLREARITFEELFRKILAEVDK